MANAGMLFDIELKHSDSPFVERIWRAQGEGAGDFLSVAATHWELVVSRYLGETTVTVRGPESKVTPMHVPWADAEWFGILFKLGTVMSHIPVHTLVDKAVDLPDASSKSFWLDSSAWQIPNYENADTFVSRLVQKELLFSDPIVECALRGEPQELTPRTVRRRFLQATGLTQGFIRQIEHARSATMLLQQGVSILDTVAQAGYADQAHLTRSLKRFIGKTPIQIIHKCEPEQMSLLFKTTYPIPK